LPSNQNMNNIAHPVARLNFCGFFQQTEALHPTWVPQVGQLCLRHL
jgi:hypothetical protein